MMRISGDVGERKRISGDVRNMIRGYSAYEIAVLEGYSVSEL